MSGMNWFVLLVSLVIIVILYNKLKTQIAQLQQDIALLKDELQAQKQSLKTVDTRSITQTIPDEHPVQSATEELLESTLSTVSNESYSDGEKHPSFKKPLSIEPDEQSLPIVTSLFHSIKNWFFGGNLVVRVGVIVLLVGVVLLLRLISEYIEISLASKLIAIGVVGLGLAALGLKLAKNRFAYGITLQGAGLAIAYLTTFFAYSVYQVLPSLPSFIGLGLLSAITIALAVRQNAFPLALLALSGGFFAPILTANDTGSLTTLFSYYLLLNITIAIIAHYRTWKALNLFGVLVTFSLAYYWGLSEDLTFVIKSQRWSLVGLVALHLALYLFVVIRYAQQIIAYNSNSDAAIHPLARHALKTTKPSRDIHLFPIDTGLLFSVPLLAFGLFSALLNDIDNALTLVSAILAVIYLGLGLLFVKRSQHYALITEGMLALGLGFLALVVPLALDAEWVAFGWSVQGLALVWFGRRSLRAWSVLFGLLLQVVSIAILIVTLFFSFKEYPTLAITVSALALLATVFILRADNSPVLLNQTSETSESALTNPAITTYTKDLDISAQAAGQWLTSISSHHVSQSRVFKMLWRSPAFISFSTFIAILWSVYALVGDFQHWLTDWQVARTTLIALVSLLSLSVYWLINHYYSWGEIRKFSHGLMVVFYIALILQMPQKFEFNYQWSHINWMIFTALIIGWLVVGQLWLKTWYQDKYLSHFDSASWLSTGILVLAAAAHYGLPDSQGVMAILTPITLMLAGLWLRHRSMPIKGSIGQRNFYWFDWQQALIDSAKLFAPISLIWVVITNWFYDGIIWGLPYFPLVNLYDLSLWLVIAYGLSVVYLSQAGYQNIKTLSVNPQTHNIFAHKSWLIILGLMSFWIISSTLVRTLHAFIGTPLWNSNNDGAWNSEQVQTGLTILWTLIALVATIIASRQLQRMLWFMGIGLLGVVVLKLVLVDLSQTEAIWRVISFLVSGSLILLIGYLAPLPPAHNDIHVETES